MPATTGAREQILSELRYYTEHSAGQADLRPKGYEGSEAWWIFLAADPGRDRLQTGAAYHRSTCPVLGCKTFSVCGFYSEA
ncbi:MAG: hypothetical protein HYZ81_22980 [Nitrospinae bacterium]|nr:hypothetical protein [Nitrospinota bacterium]